MNFDEQEKQIAQRKAKYLRMQDAQSPSGRMVGNTFVAPNALEYLASGLRGYGGIRGEQMADQESQDLQTKKQAAMQGDMQSMIGALRGTPAQEVAPLTPNDDEGNVNPNVQMPAKPGSMENFYQAALGSQFPQFQQMGMQGMAQMPVLEAKKQEMEDARQFRAQEAQANRDARAQELQIKMNDARISQQERLAAQKELREMLIQAQKDMQRMISASRQAPQVQTLTTDAGMLERRGNEWVPISVGGKPVAKAGVAAVTKTQDARDALATIDMAEKLIGKATGSGIGNAADATAAFFGQSTKGAQAAAQLKALEGDLVAKMPKMSGPQSDKDVLLYRQMAGQIGDPTIPPETKRAALQSIREMQNRYAAGGAQGASGSWDAPASSGWSITPVK